MGACQDDDCVIDPGLCWEFRIPPLPAPTTAQGAVS